ncbi:unnamed protein product [Cuscuta campestris]|uniref:Uncharacterized protein n=1 Tax=Cuscuta campestris TaxID=132261 RepID=A0A484MIF9_9ASTE|nr:unnamed protein product [Cuscuta campestris]
MQARGRFHSRFETSRRQRRRRRSGGWPQRRRCRAVVSATAAIVVGFRGNDGGPQRECGCVYIRRLLWQQIQMVTLSTLHPCICGCMQEF